MIEDAEGGGNPHDPKNGKSGIQKVSAASAQEHTENLRANSADQQDRCRQRHAHKQFDLMMEQTAVVEDAHTRDERRSNKDAHNLRAGRAIESKEYCEYHGGGPCEAAKEWDRREMNFTRSRQVDHSNAQRKRAHRNDEH